MLRAKDIETSEPVAASRVPVQPVMIRAKVAVDNKSSASPRVPVSPVMLRAKDSEPSGPVAASRVPVQPVMIRAKVSGQKKPSKVSKAPIAQPNPSWPSGPQYPAASAPIKKPVKLSHVETDLPKTYQVNANPYLINARGGLKTATQSQSQSYTAQTQAQEVVEAIAPKVVKSPRVVKYVPQDDFVDSLPSVAQNQLQDVGTEKIAFSPSKIRSVKKVRPVVQDASLRAADLADGQSDSEDAVVASDIHLPSGPQYPAVPIPVEKSVILNQVETRAPATFAVNSNQYLTNVRNGLRSVKRPVQ